MAETASMTRILVGHFFRRFFDNDTVQVDGDTQTTVVRALATVAVPGLMVAFWLQTAYPLKPLKRPPWLIIEDHYWFVLFTFVVMGAVAVFEWEMLFPDRLDFLILSPLPVKPKRKVPVAPKYTPGIETWWVDNTAEQAIETKKKGETAK